VYWNTGVTEVNKVTASIYSVDSAVDRHHLISISSCHTMIIYTLSLPTFGLPHSVPDVVCPHNCVHSQCRVLSYLLTQFLCSVNQNCSFSWSPYGCWERCGGVLTVGSLPSSSNWCISKFPMGVSKFSSDYALLPSAARLTVCIYIQRLRKCRTYNDVANLVTVTKTNMIIRNSL
jgi:hypothetical protein